MEQVDVGEGSPRTVVSGLVKHVPLDKVLTKLFTDSFSFPKVSEGIHLFNRICFFLLKDLYSHENKNKMQVEVMLKNICQKPEKYPYPKSVSDCSASILWSYSNFSAIGTHWTPKLNRCYSSFRFPTM